MHRGDRNAEISDGETNEQEIVILEVSPATHHQVPILKQIKGQGNAQ